MTHVAQHGAGRVQVVGQHDAVQVVGGAAVVDDDVGGRREQHRHRQAIGERHADRRRRLAGRCLLVDLLDRDQVVLAALLDRGRGAVDEPDPVLVHRVTGHLARVHDVVEDDQPAPVGLPGLGVEAEVGAERVRRGVVADDAVAVDLQLVGGRRSRVAVEDPAGVVGAVLRAGGVRRAQQQQQGEEPPRRAASASPCTTDRVVRSHSHPRSTHRAVASPKGPRQPVVRVGFRRSRCPGA